MFNVDTGDPSAWEQCALGPDGKPKDARDIAFFFDADDPRPMTVPTTAEENGTQIIALLYL